MSESDQHGHRFSTTHWSLVLAAGDGQDARSRAALAILCRAYWYPVYALIRHSESNPETARDLAQGFFTELLAKDLLSVADPKRGRFRSFLRSAVCHHLSHERRRASASKRGGGRPELSLDLDDAESRWRLEPVDSNTPETLFEKRWANTLLSRALSRLREEMEDQSVATHRFRCLEPFLTDQRPQQRYAEAAAELDMTESAVKKAVQRMRLRFGDLLRAEVAHTVTDPKDIDDEIRHLFATLGS